MQADAIDCFLHQNDQVYTSMRREKNVRRVLSGFICHSVSEWDGSQNRQRYKDLNEPGGFFHQRKADTPNGYEDFLGYLKKLQFMEASGFTAGQKFWFFHPLKFIRHFRRCGWLSERELVSVFPQEAIRYVKPKGQAAYWASEPVKINEDRLRILRESRLQLNKAMRKFDIAPSPWRVAAFLANAMQETQWFAKLREDTSNGIYLPWEGRGFLHLTWPSNYIRYWSFLGRDVPDGLKKELDIAHRKSNDEKTNKYLKDANFPALTAQIIQWRDDIETRDVDAAGSAGPYWCWSGTMCYADEMPNMIRLNRPVTKPPNASGVYYGSESFLKVAGQVNLGNAERAASGKAAVNGIEARFQAYGSALVVLADRVDFPAGDGAVKDWPADYKRRTTP